MKLSFPMLWVCMAFLPFFSAVAQTESEYQLFLRNGLIIPEKNISEKQIQTFNNSVVFRNQKSLVIIQFEEIPGEAEKASLKLEGIELLDYIPNNAFVATITGTLNSATLVQNKARAVISLSAKDKMSPGLANGELKSDSLDVWISFPVSSSFEEVRKSLLDNRFKITSEQFKDYQVIALRISKSRLIELATLSEVKYVEPAPGEDKPINDKSEASSRANILRSTVAAGYNLSGKGVVVGIGDDSNPMRHIDFSSRVINRAFMQAGSHGLHVTGTLIGGGIINEKYRGYAPKATAVSQYFSSIFLNAPVFSKDFGMVITNNSYGITPSTCSDFGEYTLSSYILDQQAFELPYLQHVFAAGNSGSSTLICSNGLGTILSGYQVSKNVITVGNTSATGLISPSSAKGPVKDGRTKPEISVQGTSIYSTTPTDTYGLGSGTSMAAPAVSGGLALLYQRYRDGHSQLNPKNGLMKALVCNGAGDQGLDGPDYSYGFGWMNLLRSLKMLDNNNYFSDVVSLNATKTKTITVPTNTAQLKVMLYWNDPGSSTFSGKNLVNDLDLSVTVPGAGAVLPRKHNSATPATGVDNVNNMEQVVIDNPVAGTYSVLVKGKTIPSGSQEYFVVYDTIRVGTRLTYPIGSERLIKGDQIYVSWDSYGNAIDPFKVEYYDGSGWFDIDGAVATNLRQVSWTIPDVISDQAKVRISQGGKILQESQPFTILAMPILTLPTVQCEGYISMEWTAVPGATDYEILLLKGDEMKTFDFTTNLAYAIGGLSKDTTYYVSVRARLNGNPGRQAIAKSRMPNDGTCEGSISDNDLEIESIVSPSVSGRKFTSTELTAAKQITIRIKNLDDVTSNQPISVGYSIGPDGSTINSELITPVIAPGGTYEHTFAVTANMAGTGSYRLKVFAIKAGDAITTNNSMIRTFRQIDNQPVTIPFTDQMETLDNQEISSNQVGLAGGDRYDFSNSAPIGRLRSFVNTGFAFSGTKSLTMDVNRYDEEGSVNYLISTFNLASYSSSMDQLNLSFLYKNYGQESNPNNKVWIRGNDTNEWLEIYDLFENQNSESDTYKATGNIPLSDVLKTNGQSYSSSFQVRWGQWGTMLVTDNSSSAGYSFDDIRIVSVPNDLQLVSINNPAKLSCGLGATEQVKVTVRNTTGSSLTSIPIKMQIDDGSIISKTISSIAAATTVQYTFTQTVNLSAAGIHKIMVWVDLGSDENVDNNTKEVAFYNSQVVSVFPYLQNFEADNGSWRAEGTNTSWAYGTPSSPKINHAASGQKVWKTSLSGNYNNQELSYLYSPCFGLAAMTSPTLSFSVAMDLDDCPEQVCDVVFVEYSTDGNTWLRLGSKGLGTNWYDETNNGADSWSIKDYTRWHVSTIPIPAGFPNIRFRFVFQSDSGGVREGIAIDDIHIYDLQNNIYSAGITSPTVTKPSVSGSGWINFTDNNKIIASIMPNNNNLGNTDVKTYINSATVRRTDSQYYLDRNFTIKPQNSSFANDVTVRLYFKDIEFEDLRAAKGCAGCTPSIEAYEMAVSKFSSANPSLEDGDLANDVSTGWTFFPASEVAKVPYDNGYYVEFKTKTFSEFWLAKGQISVSGALPVKLVSFTAKKLTGIDAAKEVRLEWSTSSEENFDAFEVELALGTDQVRQDKFSKIGPVSGQGHSTSEFKYAFRDPNITDFTTRYYRLKMVDVDGSFAYSTVRSIIFDETISTNVYPNPSDGIFNLDTHKNQEAVVNVYDVNGKVVSRRTIKSNEQKIRIDLTSGDFTNGVYLLELVSGTERQVFKIVRE